MRLRLLELLIRELRISLLQRNLDRLAIMPNSILTNQRFQILEPFREPFPVLGLGINLQLHQSAIDVVW